jgi:hypothetical protein
MLSVAFSVALQVTGSFVSAVVLVPFGPRQAGQSEADRVVEASTALRLLTTLPGAGVS